MKIIKNIFFLLISAAIIASCTDDSLDPLNFDKVKKGSLLVLRGEQLDKIYFNALPGAEFFPRIITGDETFEFDAEYLSTDLTTLESVDIFVIKRTKVGTSTTTERLLLRNVPFSEFQTTADYKGPWVHVSIPLTEILEKLGLDYTNPEDVEIMLDTYKFGVGIESDLNLTDGSKVLASELVAAGLYQSNQFYPAQKLTYTVTDYCPYVAGDWIGDFAATESSEFYGTYGPYTAPLMQDGVDPNKFTTDNWYDSGIPIYMVFTPSTDVETQIVTVPEQPNPNNTARTIVGSGTYNSCKKELTITFTYTQGAEVLDQLIWKLVKQE